MFSFMHSTFGVSSISGSKTKQVLVKKKFVMHGNILVLKSIIPSFLCAYECCKYTKWFKKSEILSIFKEQQWRRGELRVWGKHSQQK